MHTSRGKHKGESHFGSQTSIRQNVKLVRSSSLIQCSHPHLPRHQGLSRASHVRETGGLLNDPNDDDDDAVEGNICHSDADEGRGEGGREDGIPGAAVLAKRQRLSGTLNAEGLRESHLVIRGSSALLGTFETQRGATEARDPALLMTRGLMGALLMTTSGGVAAASETRLPFSDYLDAEGKVIEDAGVREMVEQPLKR